MKVKIVEASAKDASKVAILVTELLNELEPELHAEISAMPIEKITSNLLMKKKVFAFLAINDEQPIGVVTLHECAAIYAGGLFGEISEMYVKPEFRSGSIGKLLIEECIKKAKRLNWQRIEVGTPPKHTWHDTVRFYERINFKETGSRLRLLV